ncbi:hypothetical protein AKJ16_DCAP05523 [Drosera capensis]
MEFDTCSNKQGGGAAKPSILGLTDLLCPSCSHFTFTLHSTLHSHFDPAATMLMRTLSTPILNSLVPSQSSPRDSSCPSSPDTVVACKLSRTKSISLTTSLNSKTLFQNESIGLSKMVASDSDLGHTSVKLRRTMSDVAEAPVGICDRKEMLQRLLPSSGLDVEDGGCVGGGNGGRRAHGGGGRGGTGGGDGGVDMECYYQEMIRANPGDALLLGNYAGYLKEVQGDLAKAEEYCGRAILANPNDGSLLSMYGDIIWQTKRDMDRAQSYFDQAVKSSPDDSYVLASYAKFMWDVEEEEDEEAEEDQPHNNEPWTQGGEGSAVSHLPVASGIIAAS